MAVSLPGNKQTVPLEVIQVKYVCVRVVLCSTIFGIVTLYSTVLGCLLQRRTVLCEDGLAFMLGGRGKPGYRSEHEDRAWVFCETRK